MQVHDELVLEAKAEVADEVAKKVQEIMNGVVTLDVPLAVDAEIGKNWGEME